MRKFKKKEVHAERAKRSAKQFVVVTLFHITYPEDWSSSNENNRFSKMKTFEQCNYGDGQRGILPSIKNGKGSLFIIRLCLCTPCTIQTSVQQSAHQNY